MNAVTSLRDARPGDHHLVAGFERAAESRRSSGAGLAPRRPSNVIAFPGAPAGSAAVMSAAVTSAAPAAPVGVPTGKLRLTRRGRVVFTAMAVIPVLVLAALLGLGAGGAVATGEDSAVTFDYVTIAEGETLWGLAVGLAPNADPRDVIADVLDLNGLSSSSVQAGQRLAIPARYGDR